jgi:small-conductance mechanosensitive channel
MVVIVVVVFYLLKFIHLFFTGIERGAIRFRGFYREWADPTYKIVRFMVIIFAAIMIYPYMPGSDTAAFKGISIFLGVLISFGSSSAIANVVAGIVMTYMRPFHIGDRVKIADTMGDVIAKTLLVTRVRTIKNVDITVPNAMVLSSHIINFSSSANRRGVILHTAVTIGYDVPWKKVHELLIAAADGVERIQEEPKPFVLQTGLNDYHVTYELNAYTDKPRSGRRDHVAGLQRRAGRESDGDPRRISPSVLHAAGVWLPSTGAGASEGAGGPVVPNQSSGWSPARAVAGEFVHPGCPFKSHDLHDLVVGAGPLDDLEGHLVALRGSLDLHVINFHRRDRLGVVAGVPDDVDLVAHRQLPFGHAHDGHTRPLEEMRDDPYRLFCHLSLRVTGSALKDHPGSQALYYM